MTPETALIDLIERLGANRGAMILITDEELQQWPGEAVTAMKVQRLIVKYRPATSAICPECERDCVMPVHTVPVMSGGSASFIVCDKRSDVNRVSITTEQLIQWRSDLDLVCGFVTTCLGLRRSDRQTSNTDLVEIGIASGKKRRQMLCLETADELTLVAGTSKVSLTELVEYLDGTYSLDSVMIRQMVDAATTGDDRHTPSVVRREVRKLDTQAVYDSWKKEYLKLKKKHPEMSDAWCSQKIAKMDIAHGRDAETIRKQMKK